MKMRLRPCKREDGKEIAGWFTGERQMRMWCRGGFSFPLTEDAMESYYEELEGDPQAWGFTAMDEAGRVVGSFRMSAADYEADHVHMGYIVLAPEMRGCGAGQQMVSMAVKYAVEFLGMKRVTLKVFDCNPGAKRCYEKVGFVEAEYNKEDFVYRDETWGCWLMAYHEPGNGGGI